MNWMLRVHSMEILILWMELVDDQLRLTNWKCKSFFFLPVHDAFNVPHVSYDVQTDT